MNIQPYAIVDIETTGLRIVKDSIIEIAVICGDSAGITTRWHALIKPKGPIPYPIQTLTGISTKDVEHAPLFKDIAKELYALLNDKLFIAHHANFDYLFIQNAFKEVGISFKTHVLCTLKLSRALYPKYSEHHLDAIIKRFHLLVEHRHRAEGDAFAVYQFITHCITDIPRSQLESCFKKITRKPSLPAYLKTDVNNIPNTPGVYLFYDDRSKNPIYIGKSINLKTRILSHFNDMKANNKEFKIGQHVKHIDWIETVGELDALLLESKLVKEKMPIFNRRLRRTKVLFGLKSTHEHPYIKLEIVHNDETVLIDDEHVIGAFRSKRQAEMVLRDLSQTHHLCGKWCGLEKRQGPCFAYQLKRCFGACVLEEPPERYNRRVNEALSSIMQTTWPFKGPIAIKETNAIQQKTVFHVFEKWCYFGSTEHYHKLKQLIADQNTLKPNLDDIKIIQQYLTRKPETCIVLNT